MEEIVRVIPADSETNFRRNFVKDPHIAWTALTVVYTIVFKYRRKFDEKIFSLGAFFGLFGNPDSVVSVVDTVINTIGVGYWQVSLVSYVPVASTTGSLLTFSGLLTRGMAVSQSLIPVVFKYQAVAQILNFIDNAFLDRMMNAPFLAMDLDAVALRTMPYISFSDYKADEMTHSLLVEEYKKLTTSKSGLSIRNRLNFSGARQKRKNELVKLIKQMEIKLKDYPVMNKTQVDIPYSPLQRGLWHFLTQKGLTPTIGERHVCNLIEVDLNPKTGAIVFSKPIPPNDVKKLVGALRCLGNISEDNFFLDTKLVDTSDKLKLQREHSISEEVFNSFIDNGCYIATPKDPRIIETYLPDDFKEMFKSKADEIPGNTKLEKLNEIYGVNQRKILWDAVNSVGQPIPYTTFTNYKYEYAMNLIIEARLKFNYLPVVYSNFNKRGMETFSAYLTSQGFNHIVLHTKAPLEIRRKRIQEAQRSYPKTPISLTNLKNQPGIFTTITSAFTENKGKGWPNLSNPEVVKLVSDYSKLADNPVCVLVHPDLQEGLDLKYNEVMICLEPMLGIGNQEQVYGRIMRSMGKDEYEEYKETYKTPTLSTPPTSEEKIAMANELINAWWLQIPSVKNSQRIEIVEEKVYKEIISHDTDKRKRINKYMFQLVSNYYDKRSSDPTLYYDPQFRNWKVWSTLPLIGIVGESVVSKIDSLVNLFFQNPKRIFINPRLEFDNIRGALPELDTSAHVRFYNWIRSVWYNMLPAFDYKFVWSYNWRLVIDMVSFGKGVYQTKNIRKGEAISYVTEGSVEQQINFPTPDLYFINEITTMDLEYTQIRKAFRLVQDSDIKKLYEIGPYDGSCDPGSQYYLDAFKDSKCKLLTGKSYKRKDVCSKVGPKLTSYTETRREKRRSDTTSRRKFSLTPKMKEFFTPPGTPRSLNEATSSASVVANGPGNGSNNGWSNTWNNNWTSLNSTPVSRVSRRTEDPVNGNVSPLALGSPAEPRLFHRVPGSPGLRTRVPLGVNRPPTVPSAARASASPRKTIKQEGGGEPVYTNDPVPNPYNTQEIEASPILTKEEKVKAIEEATHLKQEFQEGIQKFIQYFKENPQKLANSKINSFISYNNPLSSINTNLFHKGGKKRKTRNHKKHRIHQSRKQRR
jgi:hypothetical protein